MVAIRNYLLTYLLFSGNMFDLKNFVSLYLNITSGGRFPFVIWPWNNSTLDKLIYSVKPR